jgi:hypothetical protein
MWRPRLIVATGHPFPPPPVLGRSSRAQPMDRLAAPYYFIDEFGFGGTRGGTLSPSNAKGCRVVLTAMPCGRRTAPMR